MKLSSSLVDFGQQQLETLLSNGLSLTDLPTDTPSQDASLPPPSAERAPRATGRVGPAESPMAPPALRTLYESSARRYNVPVNVLMAIGFTESRHNPKALGQETQWGRAKGVVQYLDDTAKSLGINPFDPSQSIDAAARQLRERLDKGADMADAVREHFAGPDRSKWGEKTKAYGDTVLQRAGQIADLYDAPLKEASARREKARERAAEAKRDEYYSSAPAADAAPASPIEAGLGVMSGYTPQPGGGGKEIARYGAPVSDAQRQSIRDAMEAATPAQRKQLLTSQDWRGSVARQLEQERLVNQNGGITQRADGMPGVELPYIQREQREQAYRKKGYTPKQAQQLTQHDLDGHTDSVTTSRLLANKQRARDNVLTQAEQDLARGASNLQTMSAGLTALAADQVGAHEFADQALQYVLAETQRNAQENPALIGEAKNIHSLGDSGRYAVEAVMENLPMMLPTLASGGASGLLARGAAKRVVGNMVEKAMAGGLARAEAEQLVAQTITRHIARSQAAGAAASGVGMEVGSIYGDIYQQTGKKDAGAALLYGVPAGLLESIQPVMALRRIAGPAVDQVAGHVLQRLGVEAGKEFLAEAGTEGLQTILENAAVRDAQGKPVLSPELLDGVLDAMLKGGIGGGVTGVAAEGLHEAVPALRRLMAPPQPGPVSRAAAKVQPQGLPEEDAELERPPLDGERYAAPASAAPQGVPAWQSGLPAATLGTTPREVGRKENFAADYPSLATAALDDEIADTDARVAEQDARRSQAQRRSLLDQVLADETVRDPGKKFATELRRAGFRDTTPSEQEAQRLQRFSDAREAFADVDPGATEQERAAPHDPDRDWRAERDAELAAAGEETVAPAAAPRQAEAPPAERPALTPRPLPPELAQLAERAKTPQQFYQLAKKAGVPDATKEEVRRQLIADFKAHRAGLEQRRQPKTPDATPVTAAPVASEPQAAPTRRAAPEEAAPARPAGVQVAQAAEPVHTASNDALQARLQYLKQQARRTGWNKTLQQAKEEVEAELRQRAAAPAPTASAPAEPAADGYVGKWFGSQERAQAFIDRKGASATHEVVAGENERWVIQRKATEPATEDAAAPQPAAVETRPDNSTPPVASAVQGNAEPAAEQKPARQKPSSRVVRVYKTKSGKVGAKIKEDIGSNGQVRYSFIGEWGAGSGHDAAHMAAMERGWQEQKRGFTVTDAEGNEIVPGRTEQATPVKPGAARYINPTNPEEHWPGRGRKPQWVTDHLAHGGRLEDLVASRQPEPSRAEAAPAENHAPGTRINGDIERAAADRLEKLYAAMATITHRNSREGSAKAAVRSMIEELRRPRTTTSVVAILEDAENALRHQYSAFAQVIQEVADSLAAKADAAPAESQKVAEAPAAKQADPAPHDRTALFAHNKIFTADKVEAARALLKAKLGQLNSGIDPELLVGGMTLAGAYIEAGVRAFHDYAKTMTEDFGEKIKPYLLSFYEAARHYPGLDTAGMTPADEASRAHAALMRDADTADVAEAVGQTAPRPAKRTRKTGAKADMVLTQDWGVEHIDGYGDANREVGNATKDAFLREARAYLGAVADVLVARGYAPHADAKGRPTKPVSVNESGPAGAGEASLTLLHPESGRAVYVQVGDACLRGVVPATPSGIAVLYRASEASDKLGTRGQNRWAPVDLSAADLAELLHQEAQRAARPIQQVQEHNAHDDGTGHRGPALGGAGEGGLREAGERRGRDPQHRPAQVHPGDVGARQPADVGAPAAGGAGVPQPNGLRAATEDVAAEGRADGGGLPVHGRRGGGRARDADAGAGGAAGGRQRAVAGGGGRESLLPRPGLDPATVSPAHAGPGDFHIADPKAIVGGGPVARFDKNRAAIELRNRLQDEGRTPTREEQQVLAGYTGWGSFGQELFQGSWNKPAPKGGWEERDRWLRSHMSQAEWEGLQRSIINAHYTDPPTVLAMWDMVRRMGFTGGRVLEPSIGIGNFFGLMPLDLAERSQRAGIELDPMTGSMAQMLYPNANIQIKGYEASRTPDDFYDLVIGNWPFADYSPADRRYNRLSPMLHDYFFLKALDQVRPGGLVVGITSAGTMDKKDARVRVELAKKAELVAAFRLPSGAFEEYAGTKVVTDILILRKRAEPAGLVGDAGWIDAKDHPTPAGTDVAVNEYYHRHPERVLGKIDFGRGTTIFREGLIVHRPADMLAALQRAVEGVPQGAYRADSRAQRISYIANHTADRTGALTQTADGLFVVQGEYLAPADEFAKYKVKSETETARREAQLTALIELRRRYAALIEAERGDDKAYTQRARRALRDGYEAYKAAHGDYSDSYGLKYLDKIKDPFHPVLAALERKVELANGEVRYQPATILSESTMRGAKTIAQPSVADAFVLARNEAVNPSLERIAELAGKPAAEVRQQLIEAGAAFETPGGDFVPSDLYLAGNVREKLRQAQEGLEQGNAAMQRNVSALEKVQPADVPYFKIETQLGATWVPGAVYADYVAHMLGLADTKGIAVTFRSGSWKVDFPSDYNQRTEASTGYGTREVKFKRLVNAAICNQTITVKKRDSDGNEYVDSEASAEANAKIADMRLKFAEWLWSDPVRRVELEREYNETRNAYATPHFDGSFLGFQGMALSLGNGPFNLRRHQVNAIWRALVMRKSLNAHEVGTGKTFTMGGIALESRRYGIAKKPMLLAHNANSKSVAAEIQMMYPAAKVLYVDNLSKDNIKTRMMQIANDDWDVVILPHSLIDRIGFREDTLMEMAREELLELEIAAEEAADEDNVQIDKDMWDDEEALNKLRSVTAKQLVKQRLRILASIQKLAQQASREDSVAFEDMGVDMVLVDEAHEFKKPPIATKMRMKGLQTQTSNRSISMMFLTRYVRGMNNGGNVHLFTGTPITNTMTEVFHMMRYMMQEEMERACLADWDGWFGSFAREVDDVELTSTGEYEAVTRLQAFINVPELRRMIGQYMDVVFADEMPEMQPRAVGGKTMADPTLSEAERAELLNGRAERAQDRPYKKVVNESSEMSPAQLEVFREVQQLAQRWRNMAKKERKEAMTRGAPESPIIHDAMAEKASFDVRLVDAIANAGKEGTPEMAPHPDSKPARAVRNLLEIYHSHPQATQVVFMEQGMSKTVTRSEGPVGQKRAVTYPAFSTMLDMIERLVQAGVPREQIAVVTGATSKEERRRTAEAMNACTTRIVFGSTDSLGVGVNMQRNLRAMHHLDAPWMPGELEQRNGRGHRQGNQWNTVLEYRYLTDRIDGRRWQVLAIKQRFITEFMKSKGEARVIEGDAASDEQGDILSTFADAAGDPRVLVREKLKKKQEQLQSRERLHSYARANALRQAASLKTRVQRSVERLQTLRNNGVVGKVTALLEAQRGDGFHAEIDGQRFAKRSEATDYLRQQLPQDLRVGDDRQIGEYGGYPLHALWGAFDSEPSLYLHIGPETFSSNGPSLPSLENALRDGRGAEEEIKREIAKDTQTLSHLEAAADEPFHMADKLAETQKQLEDLERDIELNPVAAPFWLRNGAPVDTAVFWNGKPFVVSGHRWTDSGWYVLAADEQGAVVIPYQEAADAQGMPLYESRTFEPPTVRQVTAGAAAQESSVPAGAKLSTAPVVVEAPSLIRLARNERAEAPSGAVGLDLEEARRIVKRVVGHWSALSVTRLEFCQEFSSLPASLLAALQQSTKAGGDEIGGIYFQGKVYLILDNIHDAANLEEVLFHEAYGHYGPRILFGQDYVQRYQELLQRLGGWDGYSKIEAKYGLTESLRPYHDDTVGASDTRRMLTMMDELMAHIAQQGVGPVQLAREWYGRIRAWLRGHGFPGLARYTAADLAHVLRLAREAVVRGDARANPVREGDGIALKRAATPLTRESARTVLEQSPIGPFAKRLMDAGRVILVENLVVSGQDGQKQEMPAQGLTTRDGTIYLVTNKLTTDTLLPVFKHELFHAGVRPLLGTAQWDTLQQQLMAIAKRAQQSKGRQGEIWREALSRVRQAGAADISMDPVEEFGAYAIELADQSPRVLQRWVDTALGTVKAWLRARFGVQLGRVTPDQLRALAVMALRREAARYAPQPSRPEGKRFDGLSLVGASASTGTVGTTAAVGVADARLDAKDGIALSLPPDEETISISKGNFPLADLDEARDASVSIGREVQRKLERVAPGWAQRLRDMGLKGLRPALAALPGNAVVEMYQDALPSLYASQRLGEQLDGSRQQMQKEADGVLRQWQTLAPAVADGMADLMHEATIWQMDPDQSDSVDLETLSKVYARKFRQLVQTWEAMPDDAKAVYRAVRDLYAKRSKQLFQALADRIRRAKGLDDEQRAPLLAQLRMQYDKLLGEGPYFPLARFGDFLVVARKLDQDGNTLEKVVLSAETEAEQRALAADLRERDFDEVRLDRAARTFHASSLGSDLSGFASGLIDRLNGLSISQEERTALMDDINQMLIDALPPASARKHFKHRKGVPGFSNDAVRAFARGQSSLASHIANLQYQDRIDDVLTRARHEARADQANVNELVQVVDEMEDRAALARSFVAAPWANALTQLGFVNFLGFSVSQAALNLTQVPVLTYPALAGRFGEAATLKALGRAYAHVGRALGKSGGEVRGDVRVLEKLDADSRAILQAMEKRGKLDLTMALDLARAGGGEQAPGRSRAIRAAQWVGRYMGVFNHVTEAANRQVTAIAGYRLALDSGMRPAAAEDYVAQLLDGSQFNYAFSNRPRALMSNVGRVIGMMHTFGINAMYRVGRYLHQMTEGQDAAARQAARRTVARLLMVQMILAGLSSLPVLPVAGMASAVAVRRLTGSRTLGAVAGVGGAALVMALMHGWLGDDDEPFDWDMERRRFLADVTGSKTAAQLLDRGLIRALGVDVSNRISMGDLIFRDVDTGSGQSSARRFLDDAFVQLVGGAALGVGLQWAKAADLAGKGQYWRAAEALLPKAAADVFKAGRYSKEGVRAMVGRESVHKADVTPTEIVGQALGFTPASVAEINASERAQRAAEGDLSNRRRELMARWASAKFEGDREQLAAAEQEIQAFNGKRRLAGDSRTVINRGELYQHLRSQHRSMGRRERGEVVGRRYERAGGLAAGVYGVE